MKRNRNGNATGTADALRQPSAERRGVRPLADLVAGLVDPILARKAGMTSALVAAWPEIAGSRLAETTRPEKLIWAAQRSDLDPFEPATLVVACEGASALRLAHESAELLQRIDLFFGYHAVGRLRVVQRAQQPIPASRKPKLAPLREEERLLITRSAERIESPRLRAALERYGETVLGRNRGAKP